MSPQDMQQKMASQEALRIATTLIAQKAREFAQGLPPTVTGAMALEAFATIIESTNDKIFGAKQ